MPSTNGWEVTREGPLQVSKTPWKRMSSPNRRLAASRLREIGECSALSSEVGRNGEFEDAVGCPAGGKPTCSDWPPNSAKPAATSPNRRRIEESSVFPGPRYHGFGFLSEPLRNICSIASSEVIDEAFARGFLPGFAEPFCELLCLLMTVHGLENREGWSSRSTAGAGRSGDGLLAGFGDWSRRLQPLSAPAGCSGWCGRCG